MSELFLAHDDDGYKLTIEKDGDDPLSLTVTTASGNELLSFYLSREVSRDLIVALFNYYADR